MFLVGKRVSNDYLQHIITRRQICAQSNRAATNQPLHIRLAVYRHWILLPGENRFTVVKKNYLGHQLRRTRFVRMRVINVKAVVHKHAGVEMAHRGTCFCVALVDAFLIGGWTVGVRSLRVCRRVR